jgi:glutamate racemase
VSDPRPIGVFDSGVGGLTVLREILRRSPHESTIYLGDNARAPYGVRPDDEVRRFAIEVADELVSRDVKALVVACNTSTAVALRDLRARYDLPVLGVVRPGAAAAALATRTRRVGVIATPATVRSHAYFNAIKDENPAVEVYEHATPRFVPMVEAGITSGPELEQAVEEELAPLIGERDGAGEFVFPRPPGAAIDTLLLGCTHYPLIRPVIAAAVGDRVAIVDSATATASSLAELLSVNGLEAPGTTRGTAADPGAAGHSRPSEAFDADAPVHVQLTTGDVERFTSIASRMFGEAFPDVTSVELRTADAHRPGIGGPLEPRADDALEAAR